MTRIIKCGDCGCDVIAKSDKKQFCNKCLAIRADKSKNKYRATRKIKPKRKKVEVRKPELSITEIAKRASAAGMTYGQYVMLIEGGKLK